MGVALLGTSPAVHAQGRAWSGTNVWDLTATDVIDAGDGEDPYDFDLHVLFDMSFENSWAHFCIHHFNQDGIVREKSRLAAWLGF